MPNTGEYVMREDSGLIGVVYGKSTEPDGYGGAYRMIGVHWVNGLRTSVHEMNLVETDTGWVVRAAGWQG